jgi:hypothetical protein
MFTRRKMCVVFGFIFTVLGLMGLMMPNGLVGLEGLIKTTHNHDLFHLVIGGLLLSGAYVLTGKETSIIKLVGLVLAFLTFFGLITGTTTVLGLIDVHTTTNIIYGFIAGLLLAVGYGASNDHGMSHS